MTLVQPEDITVFCDQDADRNLFYTIRTISPFLSQIPKENVQILPKGNQLQSDRLASIVYLATYDRPDFIFLYQGIPVLVCELTEHGYTGDNPLQRFTRFATTAENRIPFVYFTPFSRVRDDELDDLSGRQASRRKVNTNVWKGMSKLSEIFDVPQIAIDWVLAPNGKALKLGFQPTAETIATIFGELLSTIEQILRLSPTIAERNSIMRQPFIQAYVNRVRQLWQVGNTRDSVGRELWTRSTFSRLLDTPTTLLERITRKDYFYKDKPERLLALQCVLNARIETIEGVGQVDASVAQHLQTILLSSIFDTPLVYYSGYQWRSDPHCGVAVNLDYLYCRRIQGRTPQDREHALILFYPRIFYRRTSSAYQNTVNDLAALQRREGQFYELFVDRYGSEVAANIRIDQLLLAEGQTKAAEALIGVWGDGTKQSRIFRQYCDLIVLSDAIIVGNHWRNTL